MPGLKEIKRRLRSVRNTSKITRAMKLVSTAKLRRVQEAVMQSRAYNAELSALLAQLAVEDSGGSLTHPLLTARESINKIGVLVVGGQRGLCGPYNSNLNKKVESLFAELKAKHPAASVDWFLVGKKVGEYLGMN